MDTLLARLKPYDVRRGHVLRRYTYAGIKFQEERGWVRVEKPIADYLRTVHQLPGNPHSPLAFDVCTDEEAKALEAAQAEESKGRRSATDKVPLAVARPYGAVSEGAKAGAATTEGAPKPSATEAKPGSASGKDDEKDGRRAKRE